MHFEENNLYHIYNRGNNKQPIFFNRENYLYFLKKIQKFIFPNCQTLAWCLMPNHFHLLIRADGNSTKNIKHHPIEINALTEAIRLALSNYTQGINKQNNSTGSLFQQKTKVKCVNSKDDNYGYTTFKYIHQNPLKAKMVSKLEDWEFSSFKDFAELRNGKLCNKEMAFELFEIKKESFLEDSYKELPEELISKIF